MIDNNELIHESCSGDQWDDFSGRVEMLDYKELAAIADYLNETGLPEGTPWQDYRDVFARYSWKDFTRAYEHVMGGTY